MIPPNTLPWQGILEVARHDGWAPALTALHGSGTILLGPAGHAIVPVETERAASRIRLGPNEIERDRGKESARPLDIPGLVALRVALPAATTGFEAAATALAGLRLGLSYRLRAAAIEHLGSRQADGAALLNQQLIKGGLADIVLEHLEIRETLEAAGPEGLAWHEIVELHRRLTGADRMQIGLFGASGFTTDGPGCTGYVSELLADAYVGPPVEVAA